MNEEIKYPSKETIEKLTKELELTGADEFSQDWECEVANVDQLPEFIDFYTKNKLNKNEKSTLMRIILEAYNDLINNIKGEDSVGEIIENILINDSNIHEENIKYWACENDNLEDCFAITPLIRKVRDSINK